MNSAYAIVGPSASDKTTAAIEVVLKNRERFEKVLVVTGADGGFEKWQQELSAQGVPVSRLNSIAAYEGVRNTCIVVEGSEWAQCPTILGAVLTIRHTGNVVVITTNHLKELQRVMLENLSVVCVVGTRPFLSEQYEYLHSLGYEHPCILANDPGNSVTLRRQLNASRWCRCTGESDLRLNQEMGEIAEPPVQGAAGGDSVLLSRKRLRATDDVGVFVAKVPRITF